MSTTTTPVEAPTSRRPHRRTRALAVAAATLTALAVWAVAAPLAGADLTVRTGSGTQEVGPASVVIASVFIGLAGWALLATLERFTTKARTAWTATAVVVLLLSLTGPLTSGLTAGTTVALATMHLVVAAVLVPILVRSATAR